MTDRIPPFSQEAEQGLLGAILLDNNALDIAEETLDEGDFYREGHRKIFSHMRSMRKCGEPIDILTLVESLRGADDLERAGGAAFVAGLADSVPAAAHAKSYASTISEKAMLRRIIATAHDISSRAYGGMEDVDSFVLEAQEAFHGMKPIDRGNIAHISTAMREAEELSSSAKGESASLKTGMPRCGHQYGFDGATGGLFPGEMTVLAGRPGTAKTAIMLNWAAYMSRYNPSLIFSLEMKRAILAQRLQAIAGKIPFTTIRRGQFQSFKPLIDASYTYSKNQLWVDDSARSLKQIISRTRRAAMKYGIKVVFIDYLQLVNNGGYRSRYESVSDISTSLKGMALDYDLRLIVLAQLNRAVTRYEKPTLANLRDSGQIEQDADNVVFIWVADEVEGVNGMKMKLTIAKQRNGKAPWDLPAYFEQDIQRFGDINE